MKDIDKYLENGLSLSTRTIAFCGEVTQDSAEKFLRNLHILDNYQEGTITVTLTTEGGDVDAGLKIIDAIQLSKNYIKCICYGGVESMGTVILQACDIRLMTPNSFLMVHEGEGGSIGKSKDREQWNRLLDHQEDVCLDMYLDKINDCQVNKKKKKYTKKQLKDLLLFDKIYLPKEAVSIGLADEVLDTAY